MGIKEKIKNAKKSYWLTEGLTEKEIKETVQSAYQLVEIKPHIHNGEVNNVNH